MDGGGHPRVSMAESRDRDPVREVEVGAAGRVEQAMTDAMAPTALEVASQDRREVSGGGRQVGDGRDRFFHRPSIGSPEALRG